MSIYVLSFLIGVVAGLRALTPLAAVSWAARLGWLHLDNTWLAFLGYAATPYIFSVLAIGELINDSRESQPLKDLRVTIALPAPWKPSRAFSRMRGGRRK